MSYWIIIFFSTTILFSNNVYASSRVIDKIAAIVNDKIILESDINNLIKFIKFNNSKLNNYRSNNQSILRNEILEQLIMDQIIFQSNKKIGIKISNNQIDKAIIDIAKINNLSLCQMKKKLLYNKIDYLKYRNQIYKELLISEIKNIEVSSRLNISLKEIEILAKQIKNDSNFNTKLNLTHVFIPIPKESTYNQLLKLQQQAFLITKKLNKEIKFSKSLVNNFVYTKKIQINEIGWRNIQEFPFALIQKLSIAKKGDVIGPIFSDIGFHIFKINDLSNYNQYSLITEVRIRHILLKDSSMKNSNEILIKLKKLTKDIKNKKISFTDAAKKFSQDQNSANQGGDLGWIALDIYEPSFRNIIKKLSNNKISEPFLSSLGWHIIQLIDIRKKDIKDKLVKDLAFHIIFNHKFPEGLKNWMQEQRAKSYVKILIS